MERRAPSAKLSTAEALPTLSANRGTEPKTLTGLLRNELDWVVMKALEKDRSRRYETANGLATDVLRFLAGEPVAAHPPSAAYRLRKFVRRNRVPVTAAVLVLVALVAGIVGTTLGLLEARRQAGLAHTEAEAKEEARQAEAAERAKADAERKKAIEFRDKALDALRATTGTDVEKLIGGRKELGTNEKAYLEAIVQRWQSFAKQEGTDEQSRAIQAEGRFRVAYFWQTLGQREAARAEFEKTRGLQEQLAAQYTAVPEYQRGLAKTHNNLGNLLASLGQREAARAEYEKARGLQKQLVAQHPAVPAYQDQLATTHNNLGNLLVDLGQRDAARAQLEQARVLNQRLVTQYPAVPAYQTDLGKSYCNFGNLIRDEGHADASLTWFDKAIATLGQVHRAEPRDVTARKFLCASYRNRARAYETLKRPAEASKDWDRSIELSQPNEQGSVRAARANARVQAGQIGDAVAEVAALTLANGWRADEWYDFACVYAVAGGKLAHRKQEYADRAMALLRQAVQAGYQNAAHMKKDTDLDPLRGRDDFKKLLADLDKPAAKKP